ncbi:response regulator [uncultured Paenibacillus sp.]|uniref:response regulator n=1 Tax=uncultured Paenibacillus sp. TaxID=227322 RepID=UPI0028D0DF0B|nr:response regulator [uncultured Paenibacillus sp.]
MYKIVLVDDEAGVRESIRRRIAWKEHGFECVADCENGFEALEAAERYAPNVVLTDINMPFMDGLELTRQLSKRYSNTKVIILTGFDDFEYAQQAVKLKVNDFILKPITAGELTAVLDKLRAELDEEKCRKEDLERLRRQLHESMPVLRERFLERMVSTDLSAREMEERISYFMLPLKGPDYLVLAADADRFGDKRHEGERELLRFAVYNIVQEIAGREPGTAVFRTREEKIVCILSGEEGGALNDKAQQIAEDIRHSVETYLRFTVTVGIGRPVADLQELRQAYRSAVSALDYRLMLGTNRVISITDMEGRRSDGASLPTSCEKALIVGVKTGTREEVRRAIAEIILHLKTSNLPIEHCYIRIQKIILSLLQALDELGGGAPEPFGDRVNPLTHIYSFKTLEDIEGWLSDTCLRAIGRISEARNDFSETQIRKAEAFIKEHYRDEGLSLKAVCREVHMSGSYFSALFKQHTGKTFIEYLTAQRMEKARELLKFSDLKTYEIAARVGYADPHYFSVLFKKTTGETPSEFRQRTAVGGL